MKKIVKFVAIGLIISIILMTIGFGIATAVYSSGMELKVPHIQVSVEWKTIKHDLWLEHSVTDGEQPATVAMK